MPRRPEPEREGMPTWLKATLWTGGILVVGAGVFAAVGIGLATRAFKEVLEDLPDFPAMPGAVIGHGGKEARLVQRGDTFAAEGRTVDAGEAWTVIADDLATIEEAKQAAIEWLKQQREGSDVGRA